MGPTTERTDTTRKAPGTGRWHRSGRSAGTVLLLLALLAPLAACSSARECRNRIKADMRADAIRFAIDNQLIHRGLVPAADLELALSQGTADDHLDDDRRKQLYAPALGYANCVENHVRR